jgi:hypothetical protein
MPLRAFVALAVAAFAVSLSIALASNGREAGADAEPPAEFAPTGDIGAGPPLRPQSRLVTTAKPVAPPQPAPPSVSAAATRRGVAYYRGAGAWIDQYDAGILQDPWPALLEMKQHGVRTVYLETGSWRLPRSSDFRDRDGAELVIDQSHRLGMKVVAWYLPGLDDLSTDLRRTRAALALRTARGGRFDGFAPDIESSNIRSIPARNAALMRYSNALRRYVGPHRALGAIVPDERSTTVSPGLWPGLPYASLAPVYDVFLPMAYSTYRGHGASYVYGYTRANVEFLRSITRRPVHMIGGLDPGLRPTEPEAVVRGARDGGAIGTSFYDFTGATGSTWRALKSVAPR